MCRYSALLLNELIHQSITRLNFPLPCEFLTHFKLVYYNMLFRYYYFFLLNSHFYSCSQQKEFLILKLKVLLIFHHKYTSLSVCMSTLYYIMEWRITQCLSCRIHAHTHKNIFFIWCEWVSLTEVVHKCDKFLLDQAKCSSTIIYREKLFWLWKKYKRRVSDADFIFVVLKVGCVVWDARTQ